jgi:hypothetical protein
MAIHAINIRQRENGLLSISVIPHGFFSYVGSARLVLTAFMRLPNDQTGCGQLQ